MGIPILDRSLVQGLLTGLNIEPPFSKFTSVPLVPNMVLNVAALWVLLIRNLLDLLSRYQVLHQTTIQIFVTTEVIHYIVLLLSVGVYFSLLYLNLPFYLSSKTVRNVLVEAWTCYDQNTSSMYV